MKNLLVFITPQKKLFGEYCKLVPLWIDNSLDLGWKRGDLLLVTNFRWRYNGVKAVVVGDENFCPPRPRSIKTTVIPKLVELGLLRGDELCWNHDSDAFQMSRFNGVEAELEGVDMGLTDYGWKSRWCMGSYFFRASSNDIFAMARDIVFTDVEDEEAMLRLEAADANGFAKRHRRLNITYNFGMRRVEENYRRADHPIRVVHFHPTYKKERTWNVFVLGQNGLGHPIVDNRLREVFRHHGMG